MLHWKEGKYYSFNYLVQYLQNRSSVLMSAIYIYARNRENCEKGEK